MTFLDDASSYTYSQQVAPVATSCAKASLRRELLRAREALLPQERALEQQAVQQQLEALPQWRCASTVCGYAAMGAEVSCDGLLDGALTAGKRVLLPRCVPGRKLTWHQVDVGWRNRLHIHPYGMGEPDPVRCLLVDPAALSPQRLLIILPAVGLDPHTGGRLGYGGGYYDRFLSSLDAEVFTVGIGYKCQLVALSNLLEPTDVPLRAIVSSDGCSITPHPKEIS